MNLPHESVTNVQEHFSQAMPSGDKKGLTRRELLSASLLTGGAWLVGADKLLLRQFALEALQDPFVGGKLLGTVDFAGETRFPLPMERPLGSELDGRQFTDLAALKTDEHVVPTEKFYHATSKLAHPSKPWSIPYPSVHQYFSMLLFWIVLDVQTAGAAPDGMRGKCSRRTFWFAQRRHWTGVPIAKLASRIEPKKKTALSLMTPALITGLRPFAHSLRRCAASSFTLRRAHQHRRILRHKNEWRAAHGDHRLSGAPRCPRLVRYAPVSNG